MRKACRGRHSGSQTQRVRIQPGKESGKLGFGGPQEGSGSTNPKGGESVRKRLRPEGGAGRALLSPLGSYLKRSRNPATVVPAGVAGSACVRTLSLAAGWRLVI